MRELKGVSLEDVCASFKWLGHHGRGYTELVALHPLYKPGPEQVEWNREHRTFPITRYLQSERELLGFLQQHQNSERMLCYGINARPQVLKNSRGYERAAREDEIAIAQNILFDFDVEKGSVTSELMAEFNKLADEADKYFSDNGVKAPARAFSGNGFHLLFGHTPIAVSDCRDIAGRVAKFCDDFRDDLHKEIAALGLSLDQTQDLRRMVKVYGTAKPSRGIISRFYGGERVEDDGLASYLLSMTLRDETTAGRLSPLYGPSLIKIYEHVPVVIESLIRRDEKLRSLWNSSGKPDDQDTTGSGYDFSIARRLIVLGVRDVDLIATAIAHRPDSTYVKRFKDERYLRRTIAKALMG